MMQPDAIRRERLCAAEHTQGSFADETTAGALSRVVDGKDMQRGLDLWYRLGYVPWQLEYLDPGVGSARAMTTAPSYRRFPRGAACRGQFRTAELVANAAAAAKHRAKMANDGLFVRQGESTFAPLTD